MSAPQQVAPVAARPRPRWVAWLKRAALVAVLGASLWYLAAHWDAAERALAGARLDWRWLLGSAAAVLGAYAVLIGVWRAILGGAGQSLGLHQAARIWTVSNLGKYVPGKVWQMSAMAIMAREQGVSGVAAAGSALLSTLVTLVTGFGVTVATGAGVLPDRRATLLALAATVAALAVMPVGLPIAERVLRRATGRDLAFPRLGGRAFAIAVVGSSTGWLLLGTGFHLLGRGLGVVELPLAGSIAAFTGSYLAGFVAVFAPGGLGARESVMQAMLQALGVGTGNALVLVVASRVWLTLLEIGPALAFLAIDAARGASARGAAGVREP